MGMTVTNLCFSLKMLRSPGDPVILAGMKVIAAFGLVTALNCQAFDQDTFLFTAVNCQLCQPGFWPGHISIHSTELSWCNYRQYCQQINSMTRSFKAQGWDSLQYFVWPTERSAFPTPLFYWSIMVVPAIAVCPQSTNPWLCAHYSPQTINPWLCAHFSPQSTNLWEWAPHCVTLVFPEFSSFHIGRREGYKFAFCWPLQFWGCHT